LAFKIYAMNSSESNALQQLQQLDKTKDLTHFIQTVDVPFGFILEPHSYSSETENLTDLDAIIVAAAKQIPNSRFELFTALCTLTIRWGICDHENHSDCEELKDPSVESEVFPITQEALDAVNRKSEVIWPDGEVPFFSVDSKDTHTVWSVKQIDGEAFEREDLCKLAEVNSRFVARAVVVLPLQTSVFSQ